MLAPDRGATTWKECSLSTAARLQRPSITLSAQRRHAQITSAGVNRAKFSPPHLERRMTRTPFILAAALASILPSTAQAQRNPRAELAVGPAWLAQHLKDPDLVLLHVGDKGEYEKGHIAGARYVAQRDVSVSSMDHEKGLMLELPTADS